jgi:hypothetical protein
VAHAGVVLLRMLADRTGMAGGSKALAERLLGHDRGRVLAHLACAIADGAEMISDFRVVAGQADLRDRGPCGLDKQGAEPNFKGLRDVVPLAVSGAPRRRSAEMLMT